MFKQCLIYTKYCKDKLLFGKCYNIRDLKIIEAQDAPLDMRIKCRQSPRFVFLDGMAVYSIVLVDIIEKLQKNNANAGQLQIPLNHPAVQQMLDKIHHFIYFKYSNCPKQILAFGSSFNYGKCLINKTFF